MCSPVNPLNRPHLSLSIEGASLLRKKVNLTTLWKITYLTSHGMEQTGGKFLLVFIELECNSNSLFKHQIKNK